MDGESLRIKKHYRELSSTWDESIDVAKGSKTKAKLIGISAQMKAFKYYFGAVVGHLSQ